MLVHNYGSPGATNFDDRSKLQLSRKAILAPRTFRVFGFQKDPMQRSRQKLKLSLGQNQ